MSQIEEHPISVSVLSAADPNMGLPTVFPSNQVAPVAMSTDRNDTSNQSNTSVSLQGPTGSAGANTSMMSNSQTFIQTSNGSAPIVLNNGSQFAQGQQVVVLNNSQQTPNGAAGGQQHYYAAQPAVPQQYVQQNGLLPAPSQQQHLMMQQPQQMQYHQAVSGVYQPQQRASIVPQGQQGVAVTSAPRSNHVPPAVHIYEQQQIIASTSDHERKQQLIVNYLAPTVTSEELFSLFKQFGNLESARVIYDHQNKSSKGYGFLYFSNEESAREALQQMTGFRFHGKHLRLSFTNNPYRGNK